MIFDRKTKAKLDQKAAEMGYTDITKYIESNYDDIRPTETTIYGVTRAGQGHGERFHFSHQTQATIFGNDYLIANPIAYCGSRGRWGRYYAFEPLTETNNEITCKKCLKDYGTVAQQLERIATTGQGPFGPRI